MDIEAKMRRDWDRRADDDARFWIATEDYQSDAQFAASGEATCSALRDRLRGEPIGAWRVLEIGCGIGRILRPLAAHVRQVVGIDVSERMVRQSRDWLRDVANAEALCGNGVDLAPFSDGEFNLVYSYVAFQHMPRPVLSSYLREANRVLRPGGVLLFQAYLGRSVDPAFDDTISLRIYEPDEMRRAIADAGFAIVEGPGPSRCEPAQSVWFRCRAEREVATDRDASWRSRDCGDRVSPLDAHLQRCHAGDLLAAGDLVRARSAFEQLVAYEPNELAAWLQLISLHVELGEPAEALASLDRLIEHHPAYAPARAAREQLAGKLGH